MSRRIPKLPPGLTTTILATATIIVLFLSVPRSIREASSRGMFYVFTREFIDDLPKRLSGPGRFRFILQPLIASILGFRNGLTDARAGQPPYLYAVLFHRHLRRELISHGFHTILNLMLMGILIDSIAQWLILGASYPGAALLVGPVLIMVPYAIVRALTNRFATLKMHSHTGEPHKL